jgi:hypothetical protein
LILRKVSNVRGCFTLCCVAKTPRKPLFPLTLQSGPYTSDLAKTPDGRSWMCSEPYNFDGSVVLYCFLPLVHFPFR